MPWTPEDSNKHTSKADTPKKMRQWSDIANSVRDRCMANGGDEKECSAKAIQQANGVIAKLEDNVESFYYLTDLSSIELQTEGDKTTTWIEIFREGKWQHPKHGEIVGNQQLFNDFIDNWKNNIVGREISFDKTHDPSEGATGWVKELKVFGDRLKAKVELTPWGEDLIKNKGFRYFSPEYTSKYTHKETGKVYNNVLLGGGITNRPFLTDLSPIVMSESIEKDFKLSMSNMPIAQQTDSLSIDLYNMVCNFTDIIKNLAVGGYVSVEELKSLMDEYLSRVDFASITSMSEDFKREIETLLEEYFDNNGR